MQVLSPLFEGGWLKSPSLLHHLSLSIQANPRLLFVPMIIAHWATRCTAQMRSLWAADSFAVATWGCREGGWAEIRWSNSVETAGSPHVLSWAKSPFAVTCVDPSDPFSPAGKTEKKLKLNRNDLKFMQGSVIQTSVGFEGQGRN